MKFYPWLVYQFSVGDLGFEQISSTDDSGTQVCHLVVLCFASCLRIFCILWENGWEKVHPLSCCGTNMAALQRSHSIGHMTPARSYGGWEM